MKKITTDNIFEDIGFDKQEAADMKVRAELLLEIREYIRKKGLKQKDAAALLGINQPEVSALMHDHIFKFSIDALVNMLASVSKYVKSHLIRKLKSPLNPSTEVACMFSLRTGGHPCSSEETI